MRRKIHQKGWRQNPHTPQPAAPKHGGLLFSITSTSGGPEVQPFQSAHGWNNHKFTQHEKEDCHRQTRPSLVHPPHSPNQAHPRDQPHQHARPTRRRRGGPWREATGDGAPNPNKPTTASEKKSHLVLGRLRSPPPGRAPQKRRQPAKWSSRRAVELIGPIGPVGEGVCRLTCR